MNLPDLVKEKEDNLTIKGSTYDHIKGALNGAIIHREPRGIYAIPLSEVPKLNSNPIDSVPTTYRIIQIRGSEFRGSPEFVTNTILLERVTDQEEARRLTRIADKRLAAYTSKLVRSGGWLPHRGP